MIPALDPESDFQFYGEFRIRILIQKKCSVMTPLSEMMMSFSIFRSFYFLSSAIFVQLGRSLSQRKGDQNDARGTFARRNPL